MSFDDLLDILRSSDFEMLQVADEYLRKLSTLPFLHKDPFDRLLVSTALAEDLTIITADKNIQKYNVSWLW